jgi:putative membrane protein
VRFNQNRQSIDSGELIPHGSRRLERFLAGMLIVMAIFLVVYVARQVIALD